MEIVSAFPAGVVGSTLDNLKAAAAGENHEHSMLYPEFARVAEEEGHNAVSLLFKAVSVAENQHEKR